MPMTGATSQRQSRHRLRELRDSHVLVTSTNCTMGRNNLIYCGIDWAERTHDIALVDDSG